MYAVVQRLHPNNPVVVQRQHEQSLAVMQRSLYERSQAGEIKERLSWVSEADMLELELALGCWKAREGAGQSVGYVRVQRSHGG